MDNLKLFNLIREPAIKAMKQRQILASFTISMSMYYMNKLSDKDFLTMIQACNIMGLEAGGKYKHETIILDGERGKRYKVYDTVDDCITEWLLTFKSLKVKSIWDFETAVKRYVEVAKSPCLADLKPYVEAYKLTSLDAEILDQMYPANKTIVEVKVSDATQRIQEDTGVPKTSPITKEVNNVGKDHYAPKRTAPKYEKGERFVVRAANIYKDYMSKSATRSYNGNVWLYDGTERNGRYAVVTNKMDRYKGREFIVGYIKKSELL